MRLNAKILTLGAVGLLVTGVVGFVLVVLLISWFSNPPFGLGNAPPQPIAFPHTVHAGTSPDGMGIQCEFCHRNVTRGEAATVPAVEQCLFCHKNIEGRTETAKAEIAKVRASFEKQEPINWERVHRMPDHVRFVHEAHIRFFTDPDLEITRYLINGEPTNEPLTVQETCTVCHGDVASMTVVKPKRFQSLKMGTCLDCHRNNNVPTDCTVCHK
ncbi:MAG: hypothetical protein IH962_01365 [Chloroflexi bacterium]|nr:hypothetical protein [Chloroflexota bacterium]